VLTRRVSITPTATTGELRTTLAALSGPLLVETLERLASGPLAATPQDDALARYAMKLGPDDERLDWRQGASALERLVRALNPRPGAYFVHGGERIKVWAAEVIAPSTAAAPPGTVLDGRLAIQCGEGGVFRPLTLQRPGRKAMKLDDFLRGHAINRGELLPCPATS
jgi:methionyl-tRNA formyltransferase